MIGNLLERLNTSSIDYSINNPGIKKSGKRLYVYKLDNGVPSSPAEVTPSRSSSTLKSMPASEVKKIIAKHEASRRLHAEKSRNQAAVNVYHKSDELAAEAVRDEKRVLYGSEQSPIKDPAVIAAWDKANEAQQRLEEHREYMELVRSSRKTISDKKTKTK
jgi:hypothetical protein